jgi:hypothetical protein
MSKASSWIQPQFVLGWVLLAKTGLKQPFATVQVGKPKALENTFTSLSAAA